MKVRDLYKTLASLSNLNNATIADMAGVKRPNLYSWLGGKSQSMSEENIEKLFNVLGVVQGALSSEIVHRWHTNFEASNVIAALKHYCDQRVLDKTEIHFIEIEGYEATQTQKYNLIRIPKLADNLTILISASSPQSTGFPVKSAKLGFGQDGQKFSISAEQWSKWSNTDLLSSKDFWAEASLYLSNNPQNSAQTNNVDIDLITTYQNQLMDKTAENAGLRAIIRSLLRELQLAKPKHVLLKHENRDLIYNEFYQHEISKMRTPTKP